MGALLTPVGGWREESHAESTVLGGADPTPSTACLTVSHREHCALSPRQARCGLRGWRETWAAVGTADMLVLS